MQECTLTSSPAVFTSFTLANALLQVRKGEQMYEAHHPTGLKGRIVTQVKMVYK